MIAVVFLPHQALPPLLVPPLLRTQTPADPQLAVPGTAAPEPDPNFEKKRTNLNGAQILISRYSDAQTRRHSQIAERKVPS